MFILKAEMHDKLHMHKAKPVINAHCLVSLYSVFSGFALRMSTCNNLCPFDMSHT